MKSDLVKFVIRNILILVFVAMTAFIQRLNNNNGIISWQIVALSCRLLGEY